MHGLFQRWELLWACSPFIILPFCHCATKPGIRILNQGGSGCSCLTLCAPSRSKKAHSSRTICVARLNIGELSLAWEDVLILFPPPPGNPAWLCNCVMWMKWEHPAAQSGSTHVLAHTSADRQEELPPCERQPPPQPPNPTPITGMGVAPF